MQMDPATLYTILLFAVGICSVLAFILGRHDKSDSKLKEEVEKDVSIKKDLQSINKSIVELKDDIQNLQKHIEESRREDKEQMKQLEDALVDQKIFSEKIYSSYKSLHKRVDFLFDRLNINRGMFSDDINEEEKNGK